jgi:hypothetical protein
VFECVLYPDDTAYRHGDGRAMLARDGFAISAASHGRLVADGCR